MHIDYKVNLSKHWREEIYCSTILSRDGGEGCFQRDSFPGTSGAARLSDPDVQFRECSSRATEPKGSVITERRLCETFTICCVLSLRPDDVCELDESEGEASDRKLKNSRRMFLMRRLSTSINIFKRKLSKLRISLV